MGAKDGTGIPDVVNFAFGTDDVPLPVGEDMPVCRICGNESGSREYLAQERMFGTGEVFPYFQCARCECLQIASIPEDISRHYSGGYYSLGGDPAKPSRENRLNMNAWLKRVHIGTSERVLDVGCGQGRILHEFARAGFSSLTGIDPFIEKDIAYSNGIRIFKKDVEEMTGEFDLIMMNHSFEHMSNPTATLKKIHQLLVPGKFLLIRIPLVSSFAWKKYSTHWVSLDAPRHFYLHSLAKQMFMLLSVILIVQITNF